MEIWKDSECESCFRDYFCKFCLINMFVLRICLIILLFYYVKGSRHINCTVNPGLNTTAQEQVPANVVHIISEGEKDVIHFIWSTYKVPSVLVARTTKNVTLSINTTKLISFENDAISFKNGKPLEAVGVTFSKLWEIHYQNDSSEISDVLSVEDLDMESFFWDDVTENLKCSSSFASVTLKANNSEPLFSKAGRFEILFSVSGDQKISDEFPHLVFTKNSTLLKFVLENLYSNISSTRYGFEISLFSVLYEECDTEVWKKNVYKSINDELSPGVFSDVELLAPCSHVVNERSSFLAWRPVAYTGVVPIVANSSDVNIMKDPQLVPKFDVQSIAEVYFKEKSNVSVFNVTFGTPGDGCYVATKYTTWSLMIGTGAMAEVPLSSVVTTLISVGIGLLILFFAAGAVFMLYRRCKEKDDDLLLN